MPQFGIESTTQDPHFPRKDVRPLERPAEFAHTTDCPLFPAPNVLPNAPPDFLRRRIPLIKPGKAFLKSFQD
jgi:hypothetical protein